MGLSPVGGALSVRRRTSYYAWLLVPLLCGFRPSSTVAPQAGLTATTAPTAGSPRIPSAVSTIQRSPVFREATALFDKKQYREALTKLDRLADDPDLTPADREFLTRQQQICRDAIDGKPTPAPKSSVTPAPQIERRPPPLGDCGPRALVLAAQHLGIKADSATLTKVAGTTIRGASLDGLNRAAKSIGLMAEGVQMDRTALSQLDHPAIAWADGNHYLAVVKVAGDQATIHDPNKKKEEVITTEELLRRSGGILLTLRRQ